MQYLDYFYLKWKWVIDRSMVELFIEGFSEEGSLSQALKMACKINKGGILERHSGQMNKSCKDCNQKRA